MLWIGVEGEGMCGFLDLSCGRLGGIECLKRVGMLGLCIKFKNVLKWSSGLREIVRAKEIRLTKRRRHVAQAL